MQVEPERDLENNKMQPIKNFLMSKNSRKICLSLGTIFPIYCLSLCPLPVWAVESILGSPFPTLVLKFLSQEVWLLDIENSWTRSELPVRARPSWFVNPSGENILIELGFRRNTVWEMLDRRKINRASPTKSV